MLQSAVIVLNFTWILNPSRERAENLSCHMLFILLLEGWEGCLSNFSLFFFFFSQKSPHFWLALACTKTHKTSHMNQSWQSNMYFTVDCCSQATFTDICTKFAAHVEQTYAHNKVSGCYSLNQTGGRLF